MKILSDDKNEKTKNTSRLSSKCPCRKIFMNLGTLKMSMDDTLHCNVNKLK